MFFATCASVSYFAALTKRLLWEAVINSQDRAVIIFFYYSLLFRLVEGVKVFILHGKMHSRRHRVFTDFADADVCVAS